AQRAIQVNVGGVQETHGDGPNATCSGHGNKLELYPFSLAHSHRKHGQRLLVSVLFSTKTRTDTYNPITSRPFGPKDGHHDSALRFLGFFSHALLVPGSETEQSRAIS